MAITAAIRTNIIELNVLAGNGAPGTTGLGALVTTFDKSGIAGVAASITGAASWTAKFPSFQTPEEFGKEFLEMIVPGLSAAGMTEGIAIIAGLLNSGSSQADVLSASSNFLAAASVTDAAFGDYAAKFQNQAAVAEFHTVTQEKDTPLSLADITSDAASVVTAKGDIDGSTAAAAATAAAATAAAAAATATAAADAAAATAAAALVTAATDAAAAATTAIATATAADTALATAVAASTAADTKAALTDAAALATAATAAAAADTTAQATLTAANTAYTAAIAGGDAATVSLANGTKLIAVDAAATTAAASVAAAAASAAATADDAAAVTALAAEATALTASNTAKAAADTAAAAAATAAAATPDTTDDTAATAQVASAAASSAAADEINAAGVSTAALAAATTAVAAGATANTAATAAIAAVNSDATAATASTAANAAVAAATAATTATAAATTAAAAAGATAADAASAATLAASAATQAAAATASVASATAASNADLYPVTLALTAATDVKTGGAGNDQILGSSTTYNSDDIINGGLGSDTLAVTTAAAGGPIIGNLTSIETVKVTNGSGTITDVYTINMIGSVGVTDVQSRLSSADVSYTNLPTLTSVTAYGTTAGADITASYVNTVAAGTADSITINADGGTSVGVEARGNGTGRFETLNLVSSGASKNTVTFAAVTQAGAKAVNISGSAATVVALEKTKAKAVVDASTATGKQTISVAAGDTGAASLIYVDTITGGTADDTITVTDLVGGSRAATTLFAAANTPKTIDGGAGTDTLSIAESVSALTSSLTATTAQKHAVSNIETLQINTSLADGGVADLAHTIEADLFTGLDTIKIRAANLDTTSAGGNGEDVTVTINDIDEETINFAFTASGTSTTDELIVVNLKSDSGAADSISLVSANPTAITATSVSTMTIGRSTAIASSAIETVNITGSAYDISTTDGTTILILDAQYSNTLNLDGTGSITIGSVELLDPAGAATAVINASGMSKDLTLSTAFKTTASDSMTITLGSGKNGIDFGVEALSTDVITGTTGTDTVSIKEAGANIEPTISTIDIVKLTGTQAAKTISAKKFTDVGNIAIYDRTAGDSITDNLSVTKLQAGQKVQIYSTSATNGDWNGGTIKLAGDTGVTTLDVTTKGLIGLEGTGILNTNATTLNLDIGNVSAAGLVPSQTIPLVGSVALTPLTNLVLSGGGPFNATSNATLTLSGGTNVNINSLDATGYTGNLVMSGLITKVGGTVTMGSGANTITPALADLARDALTIDGGGGADKMVIANLTATLSRPSLKNIETLDIDLVVAGGATELSLADTTGVTTVEIDLDAAQENFTVSGASSVTAYKVEAAVQAVTDIITLGSSTTLALTNSGAILGDGNTSLLTPDATTLTVGTGFSAGNAQTASIDLTTLTAAKAVNMTIGGTGIDVATSLEYIGEIDIATLTAAKLTTLVLDADQGELQLPTINAAKLASVTVTGDNIVNFGTTAASTAALTTFDASAATGAITIGEGVDFASGATVSTGTANDSVSLSILTEANTAVDMGAKLGDTDTLIIAGANNMGSTVIDLSAAADQMTQANGAVNGSVQTGIENVTLSGLTGSQGVTVTGSAAANIIIGSPKADVISGGAGIDVITPGAGNDNVSLTESVAKLDTVTFAATALLSGANTITGFTAADAIDFSTFAGANTVAVGGEVADGSTGDVATSGIGGSGILNDSVLLVVDADGNLADTPAGVAGLFDDATNGGEAFESVAANADVVVIVRDTTNNETQIWYVDNDNTAVVAAGEVVLVGTITGYDDAFVDANIVD